MSGRVARLPAVALVLALVLVGCPRVTVAAAAPPIAGAGSTFVAPLMIGKWIPDYVAANPGAQITYSAVGSGAGIRQWTAGAVDFADSDALLTPSQDRAARARCGTYSVIPATISAVAIIYNVPGLRTGLHLSPSALAGILLGRITNWSDAAIRALNPGVRLPDLIIQPVHRSDGSGTTYITTQYLAAVSAAWRQGPGAGATVAWPVGVGAKGSAGIVQTVTTLLGGIGYVDLAYAVQNNIDYARIQNARGNYVAPGTAAASAAAASFAPSMPQNLQQIIVDSGAPDAYPITGYSYIMLCARQPGARGQALLDFVRFAVTTGQASAEQLDYAPLPASVQALDTAALDKIGAAK
jgi:phosphate transport system substrate-binding protein